MAKIQVRLAGVSEQAPCLDVRQTMTSNDTLAAWREESVNDIRLFDLQTHILLFLRWDVGSPAIQGHTKMYPIQPAASFRHFREVSKLIQA